jgi:hypothetical protein
MAKDCGVVKSTFMETKDYRQRTSPTPKQSSLRLVDGLIDEMTSCQTIDLLPNDLLINYAGGLMEA